MKYQLNTIKRKYQPGMLKKLEPLLLNLMWLAQDYAKTLIFICTILVLQGKCIIFLAQQEAQKKKTYHQNDPSKVSTAFICSSLWTESSLGEHR